MNPTVRLIRQRNGRRTKIKTRILRWPVTAENPSTCEKCDNTEVLRLSLRREEKRDFSKILFTYKTPVLNPQIGNVTCRHCIIIFFFRHDVWNCLLRCQFHLNPCCGMLSSWCFKLNLSSSICFWWKKSACWSKDLLYNRFLMIWSNNPVKSQGTIWRAVKEAFMVSVGDNFDQHSYLRSMLFHQI